MSLSRFYGAGNSQITRVLYGTTIIWRRQKTTPRVNNNVAALWPRTAERRSDEELTKHTNRQAQ